MARASIPALLAFALLTALPLSAAAAEPPEGAARAEVGGASVAAWVGRSADATLGEYKPGTNGTVYLSFRTAGPSTAAANVTLSTGSAAVLLSANSGSLALSTAAGEWRTIEIPFRIAEGAKNGPVAVAADVKILEDRNGTAVVLGSQTIPLGFSIVPKGAPPPGATPWPAIAGGVGVAVLVGGGIAYAVKQRRQKRVRPIARSAALRAEQLEKIERKSSTTATNQATEMKEELRRVEEAKEKRREVQILEAKVGDARKMLQLLRTRHEAGQLTKLQYDRMREKKEAELSQLEAELARELNG